MGLIMKHKDAEPELIGRISYCINAKMMILKRALPHTGTVEPIAPLPAAVVELAPVDEEVETAAALVVAEVEEPAVDLAAAPGVDPEAAELDPIGAVDWPLISAEIDASKLPVMFANANRAENDI